jgi:tripeptidyl-peptidase I
MFALKLFVAAAIVTLSNAAPAPIKHVLHEERQTPSDWVKVARIESTAILPMRIGLTQSNLEKGHDFLMEV